ncbi:MAG TPA: aminoglycoside phosphotransferase family protein [Pseudonocardiaceae bacterium]|jgi:aminoglycoside phosphotransferase (APT) family kinase protein|nr:aminoglycoside phosphotransferase family protein [Pseudonocardiaceae bacterium]
MYRLPGDLVARVGRPGTVSTAEREVEVSGWLAGSGLAVTQAAGDIPQPIVVEDRPVTWWRLLPEHRAATPAELGSVLRALHGLPVPSLLGLPVSDPFADLDQRIADTAGIGVDDRAWLAKHLADLRERYRRLSLGEPQHVIHGDAWQGNVAVPPSGVPILLDFEHVSIGHPDWDLIPLAVDYTDFARLDAEDYRSFVHAYGGHDVTTTPGFRTLAEIQELRWVCFVISKSASSGVASKEARHRIACLRGEIPRPWSWTAF